MKILKRSTYFPWLATAMVAVAAFFSVALGQAQAGHKGLSAEQLQEIWDRQEIEQLMYRHARSLDRMDGELMKSTYWEDAIEEHQDPIYPDLFFYNGNAWTFVPMAMEGFKALKVTQHRISNILIELDGDKATAESYVFAYHVHEEDGVDKEGILGGRHHFRLEKRNGEWRILHRSTVFDWNINRDATAIWSEKFADKYRTKRDYRDDSYNYLRGPSRNELAFFVEFHLKPEYVEEWKKSALAVIEQMVKEDTFVETYLDQDADDPTKFTLYERWSEPSREAFMKNQLGSKGYRKAYEENLPSMLAGPRVIKFLDAERKWTNVARQPSVEDLAFYVEFQLKPERVEEWKRLALEVLNRMAKEESFVSAYLHQDANDPNKFSLYERWAEPSREAFIKNQLHGKEYRNAYEERLPALLASPRVINFLDADRLWQR